MNNRGLIANCYAAGTISGNADRVAEGAPSHGGIAGVHAGTIVNSYSVADVVADCYSGYIGSVAGWATGIADTFQTYYAKDAKQVTDDKTENRLEISPAVAIGWQVGPGVNDEGEKYTGSVSIDVTGFTTEDMISDFMAAVLNQNFGKLKIDLANGGRQTGHWTGSEALSRSRCSWKVDENTLLYCLDTEKKSLAKLQEKGTAYARLSEVEKVQDVFAQILKELMSRMQRRKEAATEIEKEPWIILLIDDIKECNSLPDDIQMQLHRIMTKTKGYGVLVLCGIRQGDLFNFYTQDQLGVDLKSSGSALALSDTAVHYEGFYKNNFTQSQRNAELEKGFGIFFAGNGGRKIKCIDSQEAGR